MVSPPNVLPSKLKVTLSSYFKNNSISYEKFIEYCEARKTEFKYNYSFLKEKGLEKKYVYKLLESCDLFSLFNELIKIE
jgi:hypothetical protein